jgi:DNA-binding XRE family transcriptional regulator
LLLGLPLVILLKMTAEELKQRRETLGMSRDDLAKALLTTPVTVWRWENGERAIPPYLPLALETVERQRQADEPGAKPKPSRRKRTPQAG